MSPNSHLGEAVKQLAPTNLGLQSSMERQVNGSGTASVPLKRNPGSHLRTLELWGLNGDAIGKLAYSAFLGFVVFSTLKSVRFQFGHLKYANPSRESASMSSLNEASASEGYFITSSVRKHFENLSKLLWLSGRLNSNSKESDKHPAADDITAAVCKQNMDIQEAEALVKQWQDIKSEALGPDYQTDMLPEILDGSILAKVCLCICYLFACAIDLPLFILCVIIQCFETVARLSVISKGPVLLLEICAAKS